MKGFVRPGGGWTASPRVGFRDLPMTVPCGRCAGCLAARAKDWGVRIAHEATFYPESVFATLTYDSEHLPADGCVSVREAQLFIKRLRRSIEPGRCRYFICGEYGETSLRPHYHVIIFGVDFAHDRCLWRVTSRGDQVFRSPSLEALWPYGLSEFGSVTAASGSYVAGYVTKKLGVQRGDGRAPEFGLMSRKPAIGDRWFSAFGGDCFPSDFLVVEGRKVRVPRRYSRVLRERDPEAFEVVRRERVVGQASDQARWNRSDERLAVRAEVQRLKGVQFVREPGGRS
jgi:hypothetical protein